MGKWLRATAVYTDSFGASKTAAAVTADAVLAPPAAPAGVVALIGNRKVTLVWDNPEDPTISRYQRGLRLTSGSGEPGVYLNVHNSGPDTTTASIGSLNNGTSYTVYLRAVNAAGPGPATQIAATPKASSPIVFYSPATRSVAENTTAVMTVRAGNADVDASYVVTGGADKDSFVIDNTTGVLAFKTAPDYENPTDALSESPGPANAAGNNEYILVVTAIWQTEQIKQTITVTVTNVDDPGVVTITPVEPVAGEELTAGLVDQDAPVEDVIWQWARADAKDGSYTDISGATSTAYTPVAADDGGKWLRATAAYADGLGAKKTAGAVTASSVAASVTNQPPAFDPKTAARSVDENSPPGTAVGAPVAATDDDSGDTLTYSMTGPDAGSFSFNTATAQITTKSALDHEGKSEYSVTVSVSDSKTADGLPSTLIDDTIEVAITVTDVDEAGTVSFTARPLLSRQITARVVDPDVPVEDVTWQWAATADAPSVESRTFVEISGATSAGYTPVAGDVGKWLRATAVYTDSFGASKTAAAVTGAAVLAPPAAPTGVNALPGDAKVTLRWDNPRDGTITRYERGLRRSASAGVPQYLNVHNSGPGTTTVTVEGLVNATSYTFYLRAVNAAGPGPPTLVAATPTATPSFEFRSPATPSVHENTTAVITLRAGNADIDAGATTYSITGGADQTAFTLDNTSGVLAFKTAPDYENPTDALSADPANAAINNQYIVVVEAANGQQTTSQTITVTVTNIDEPGTVSFDSTAPKEGTALAATLTDPDGNLSGLTWSWERSADQTTWEAATGSVTSTGATSAYTPDAADGDKQLRATAAYTDGHASGKSASAVTTAAVTAAAPPSCAGSVATPSGSSEGLVADCEALLAAEGGLAGSGSLDWATTTAIADWAGVTLAGDRVAELDLSEMSLTGTIPAGLGGLSTLEYLDLSGNELAGEIPAELGGLSALWHLDVSANELTGEIPVELGDLSALEYLDLSANALTGGVPEDLGDLSALWGLYLNDNMLAGAIPAELATGLGPRLVDGGWVLLSDLDLSGNKLTGEVALSVSPVSVSEGGGPKTVKVTAALDAGSAWAVGYGLDRGSVTVSVAGSGASGAVGFAAVADFDISLRGDGTGIGEFTLSPTADSGTVAETVSVTADGTVAMGIAVSTAAPAATVTIAEGAPANSGPRFATRVVTLNVNENAAAGAAVGEALSAADPNSDAVAYSLRGCDDLGFAVSHRHVCHHAALFGLDTSSGQLTVKAPLDYETNNRSSTTEPTAYVLTVDARDNKSAGGGAHTAVDDTIMVIVNVVDVDEPGVIVLSTAAPAQGAEVTATVFDGDYGPNQLTTIHNIAYKWERLDTADATSGTTITTATGPGYTPTSDDAGKWLRVTVSYNDKHSPDPDSKTTATATTPNPVTGL